MVINDMLSLNMLLDLPKEILKKSEEYNEYSEILRKEVYEQYNFKEIKTKIRAKFNKFKDIKYCYKFPYDSKVTSVYSEVKISRNCKNCSPVEKRVVEDMDAKIWVMNFYNLMLRIASKLTMQETIYLVDTFFSNKSEDIISEKLGICRNTLQNIKKSCLVKTWLELEELN